MFQVIDTVSIILMLSVLGGAAICDAKYYKIPNSITFPAILIGLALSGLLSWKLLVARFLMLVLLFWLSDIRLMGMGDLKLLMAIIALRGTDEAIFTLLIACIFMFFYCCLKDTQTTVISVKNVAIRIIGKMKNPAENITGIVYPFAPFIFIGYIATFLLVYF